MNWNKIGNVAFGIGLVIMVALCIVAIMIATCDPTFPLNHSYRSAARWVLVFWPIYMIASFTLTQLRKSRY
jgi:hypothetical protein